MAQVIIKEILKQMVGLGKEAGLHSFEQVSGALQIAIWSLYNLHMIAS